VKPGEGWAWPTWSLVLHFFVRGRSLCQSWTWYSRCLEDRHLTRTDERCRVCERLKAEAE